MKLGITEGDKVSVLESCLISSNMVYRFQSLRDIVKDNDPTLDPDRTNCFFLPPKKTVDFTKPELVYTELDPTLDTEFKTKLTKSVKPKDILEFLRSNRKYLKQKANNYDFEFNDKYEKADSSVPLPMEENLERFSETFIGEAEMVEFDDEFSEGLGLGETELVHSIVLNKKEKRLVLVFRGSAEPKDWLIDFRFLKTQAIGEGKDMLIHKGFYSYLAKKTFNERKEGDTGTSKLTQIIDTLRELYKKYPTYELFVTGHSLGGALAQLSSFMLADSVDTDFIPKPIVAITYASPVVGNDVFVNAYEELEKANKLRHIRISNENDIVACVGATLVNYGQTGVNFHVKEEPMEIKYENPKSFFKQLNIFRVLAAHSLYGEGSYFSRLYKKDKDGKLLNEEVLHMTIEEVYKKYANIPCE